MADLKSYQLALCDDFAEILDRETWREIVQTAVNDAKGGDEKARKWLSDQMETMTKVRMLDNQGEGNSEGEILSRLAEVAKRAVSCEQTVSRTEANVSVRCYSTAKEKSSV